MSSYSPKVCRTCFPAIPNEQSPWRTEKRRERRGQLKRSGNEREKKNENELGLSNPPIEANEGSRCRGFRSPESLLKEAEGRYVSSREPIGYRGRGNEPVESSLLRKGLLLDSRVRSSSRRFVGGTSGSSIFRAGRERKERDSSVFVRKQKEEKK